MNLLEGRWSGRMGARDCLAGSAAGERGGAVAPTDVTSYRDGLDPRHETRTLAVVDMKKTREMLPRMFYQIPIGLRPAAAINLLDRRP